MARYLYRTIIKGICCEIGIANKPKATIILCPGLPGYPKEQEILKKLMDNGYNVIYPRYKGTFESDGNFLEKSPAYDVIEVIDYLKKQKKFRELYFNKTIKIDLKRIILAGSSFGGSVVLHVLGILKSGYGIVLCPVVNFKEHGSIKGEQDLKRLMKFLKKGFKYVYRFQDKDFRRLLANKVILPADETLNGFNGKIILYHGIYDNTVNIKRSKELAKKFKFIRFKQAKKGHFNLSDLPLKTIIRDLESFFSKRSH